MCAVQNILLFIAYQGSESSYEEIKEGVKVVYLDMQLSQ